MYAGIVTTLVLALLGGPSTAQRTRAAEPPADSFFWADYDGDDLVDAFVTEPGGSGRLLRNEGDGTFSDQSAAAGLLRGVPSRFAAWCDFDCDGDADLFLGTTGGAPLLYRNAGNGTFEEIAAAAGLEHVGAHLHAGWLDYDRDGRPDLHVRTEEKGLLYRNLGEGLFAPVDLGRALALSGAAVGVSVVASGSSADESPERSDAEESLDSTAQPRPGAPTRAARGRSLDEPTSQSRILTGSGPVAGGPPAPAEFRLLPNCAKSLDDTSSGSCLFASSTPELGMLYPLSSDLFVDAGGRVGISTTSPRQQLSIGEYLDLYSGSDNGPTESSIRASSAKNLSVNAGPGGNLYLNFDAGNNTFVLGSGNLGVGTTSPTTRLHVNGDARVDGGDIAVWLGNKALTMRQDGTNSYLTNKADFVGNSADSGGILFLNGSGGIRLRYGDGGVVGTDALAIDSSGRVGIGTTTPAYTLDVNGDVRVDTLELTGADLVEAFDTRDEQCEPGTVVSIDAEHAGEITSSREAYDRKVAGVVSGAGDVEHGIYMGRGSAIDGAIPIAMTGRVYVKCTTENGAITPGDRLTTSSLAGHAMRATDVERASGAVIGKAMSSLDEKTGLVLVLVNLQ